MKARRNKMRLMESLEGRTMLAYDVWGVFPVALDQPRVNAYISLTNGGEPLEAEDGFGSTTYNIEAYYDTGASGVLLSAATASAMGLTLATHNGQSIVYSDVGVGGTQDFNVSEGIYISLGVYGNDWMVGGEIDPEADIWEIIDQLSSEPDPSTYTSQFGPIRMQVGIAGGAGIDPTEDIAWDELGDLAELIQLLYGGEDSLDVFGMPLMQGKVVVMDARPVNDMISGYASETDLLGGTMRTYIYAPGTPYRASTDATDPGIVGTNRHIKLSYVSFDDFTEVAPAGATGPTMSANPFIGPSPLDPSDTTQGITASLGTKSFTGSYLLDTGAAASMISVNNALSLGVRYRAGTFGTSDPVLEYLDGTTVLYQYTLTIMGVGGQMTAAGFYMDSLSIPTVEGDPIVFHDAPVLVMDITVVNPTTDETLTLDGIFGMNFLVGSGEIMQTETSLFPELGAMAPGAFDWVVFDQPNGRLGVRIADLPSNPPTATLVSAPAVTKEGGTVYSFTVKYEGESPISVASLDLNDLQVTTPKGATLTATPHITDLTDSTSLTVTYSIVPPDGKWDFTDSGTYTLTCNSGQVLDAMGLSAAAAPLGSFAVNIADTSAPTATLSKGGSPTTGKTAWNFTVVYKDNDGVKKTSIGAGDIVVVGPNRYTQAAKYISRTFPNATTINAVYQIPAPGGKWDAKDNGTYTIKILGRQVCDVSGNYIAAGKVGTMKYTATVARSATSSTAIFSTTLILGGVKKTPPDEVIEILK